MKKIAGILICIALAFGFIGCSWQIPQKVSVKTDADYNFALGNFEKDFSENLNVSKIIGDLQLPNNGKVYDYWPNKQGDTQKFLMYMPLQEIPIDIGSYFDKGSLADSIKNISFEKEIEVPEVSFSFPVEFKLDDVNTEINKQFVLAGLIQNYNASQFGAILKQVADSVTYEKGVLVVKAYAIDSSYIDALNNGTATIQSLINEDNVYTSYSGGSVSITSGNQAPLTGYFYNGQASLAIPSKGFDFISDDINISFSDIPIPNNFSYQPLVFVAKMDTNQPYQIKKISGIGNAITIPSVSIDKKIDSLESLKDSGVEECTIGEGSIDLDFDIPSEWKNVTISYGITLSGGIEATSGNCTAASGSSNNVGSIDLSGTSVKAEEINVSAAVALTIAGATIDFTKPPAISFDSNISRIETVTVKLSDTNLSISDSQALPDEVLDILTEIELKQCGITGTYTNTLPEGNEITFTVSSDFIGLESITKTIEGGKEDAELKILTPVDEEGNPVIRKIKLAKNPSASDEFNAFDFDVNVALPGGEPNKVTVRNVAPGSTYKLAIDITPVIDWKSVTINTENLELPSDKIGTGFDPSTIFNSINDVLGEGFSDNIEIPECNLYLYITKPEISALANLSFSGSEISMYYGDSDKNQLTGTEKTPILSATEEITFANAAPTFDIIKGDDGSEIVTSKLKTAPGDITLKVPLSSILTSLSSSGSEEKQLCVDYSLSLSGAEKGEFTIENDDDTFNLDQSGSIGIYAVIELPLSFEVAANSTIDLKKLINKDDSSENSETSEDDNKDLFGRSEASGFDEIEKYLKIIDTAEIKYRLDSFPIETTDDINFVIAMGDDSRDITKTLKFNTDDTEPIVINNEEVMQLLDMYPLKLQTAEVVFPKTTAISIPRTKKLDINLQIGISTNGEPIEIFGGNK